MNLLTPKDCEALFAFEYRNKAWFERWVPPRPAAHFDPEEFPGVLSELVGGMSGSTYLLFVEYRGDKIVGRFNFSSIGDEQAEIGYRVCQEHLGQGIASKGVAYLKDFARAKLSVKQLTARASPENLASQKVLLRHGFVKRSDQERVELGGRMIVLEQFSLDL